MVKYLEVQELPQEYLEPVQMLQRMTGSDWHLEVYPVKVNKTTCILHIVQVRGGYTARRRRVVRTLVLGRGVPRYDLDLYVHIPTPEHALRAFSLLNHRLENLWTKSLEH